MQLVSEWELSWQGWIESTKMGRDGLKVQDSAQGNSGNTLSDKALEVGTSISSWFSEPHRGGELEIYKVDI